MNGGQRPGKQELNDTEKTEVHHPVTWESGNDKEVISKLGKVCPNRNWASQKAHQCRRLTPVSVV